jgi:DtxR family Mn-dependent transcriptional regulator
MTTDQEPRLSVAEQSYLLAIRSAPPETPLTSAALARRLHVSPQAAGEMLRRMVADGVVMHSEDRAVCLTPQGRAAADEIFRRHALAEWLLISVVGLGWAESDEEAMRLQSAISPRLEAALDELMGHPETCPHGNPIEEAVGARRPSGELLSSTASGERVTIYRITEEAEEDAGLLSYLEARGLTPGARVTVLASSESTDSVTLEGPIGRATLGLRPAALIRVLPGDADPALFHRVPARAASAASR